MKPRKISGLKPLPSNRLPSLCVCEPPNPSLHTVCSGVIPPNQALPFPAPFSPSRAGSPAAQQPLPHTTPTVSDQRSFVKWIKWITTRSLIV